MVFCYSPRGGSSFHEIEEVGKADGLSEVTMVTESKDLTMAFCGLCQCIAEDWEKHVESEQHQSNLQDPRKGEVARLKHATANLEAANRDQESGG